EDEEESSPGGMVGPHRQNGHKCHGEGEDEETTDGQECEQPESHGPPTLNSSVAIRADLISKRMNFAVSQIVGRIKTTFPGVLITHEIRDSRVSLLRLAHLEGLDHDVIGLIADRNQRD